MLTVLFLYASIPITSGIIGWGTNVLAIKMMFAPLEFVGIRPFFGWQGVIPAKAHKMASICAELLVTRLLDVEAAFRRLDPQRVARELQPTLRDMTEEIVENVISENYPRFWEMVPRSVKERTYARIHAEIPLVVERIVRDLQGNIKSVLDLRSMVVDAFVRNKVLLNQLFLRCGNKEFEFIGRSGFYFGAFFGLFQMIIWIFYKPWWFLPTAGLVVGYATNWLALKMIFEPLEPRKYGPFRWHGLFLKRQSEVSKEYAAVFAGEVFKPANIVDAVLRGTASERLFALVQRHLKEAVDDAAGAGKPFVVLMAGTQRYVDIKQTICDRLMQKLPESLTSLYDYANESLDLQGEVERNLLRLSPQEFEQVLHPIFQEDEWILIAVGAVLGAIAGGLQLALFLF